VHARQPALLGGDRGSDLLHARCAALMGGLPPASRVAAGASATDAAAPAL